MIIHSADFGDQFADVIPKQWMNVVRARGGNSRQRGPRRDAITNGERVGGDFFCAPGHFGQKAALPARASMAENAN